MTEKNELKAIEISSKKIKVGEPVFIIAELSANHNHDYNLAKETIRSIKESGADAVKLQTYTADTMTIDCDNEYFQIKQGTLWDGITLYELYNKAFTPWEWQPELKKYAEELGLICFSTPFDKSAVDFLDEINVAAYKVASFEITDIPLIQYIASKRKPIMISTGIASINEMQTAINSCKEMGNDEVILLKCTSSYPAPIEKANLLTLPDMIQRFNVPVGLSDHTIGDTVSIAAVALGACVIEKHFILDRKLGGPDATFSMEPSEFKKMVKTIREVEKVLGCVTYELSQMEKQNRVFSRSLFVVRDMKKGDNFSNENVKSIRPGYGIPPKYINEIIGKKTKFDLKRGTPLKMEYVE